MRKQHNMDTKPCNAIPYVTSCIDTTPLYHTVPSQTSILGIAFHWNTGCNASHHCTNASTAVSAVSAAYRVVPHVTIHTSDTPAVGVSAALDPSPPDSSGRHPQGLYLKQGISWARLPSTNRFCLCTFGGWPTRIFSLASCWIMVTL